MCEAGPRLKCAEAGEVLDGRVFVTLASGQE